MTGRTHDLAAFSALGIYVVTQPIHEITLATGLLAIGANLIGGITPDIDQPTAPLWRSLPVGGVIGRVFDKLIGGHRFISHSLLGLALFGLLWYGILTFLHPSIPTINTAVLWWAFMIGVTSHLVMDSFTTEGVPWLLPLPIRFGFPPFKMLRMHSGGIVEKLIVFPGLIIFNIYLYYLNYGKILDLLRNHLK